MTKTRKPIFIVLAVLAAVLLLSILQIVIHRFNNPTDQPGPDIAGNACLIWGTAENESAVIPVQASLTRKHYMFGNKEDGICLNSLRVSDREFSDTDIWMYWAVMQDEQGAAIDISGDENFSFFYSSADMDLVILGVCDASRILDDDSNPDLSGKKAVLIMPADDGETAWKAVQKAYGTGMAGKSFQEWLTENHLDKILSES